MYKNKFCVLYWFPYRHCVINGLEWQNDFELFLLTDKFIMHVAIEFKKAEMNIF